MDSNYQEKKTGKGAFPDNKEAIFEFSLERCRERSMTRYTFVFYKGYHNLLQALN